MKVSTITINHPTGLHARPAALFVQVASKFQSRIWVEKGSKKVNAKSIMGVMSLSVRKGDEVIITADGKDEKNAMEAIKRMVESNFTDIPDLD
jgi:phosphocarrier protein HPr